jgi:hypothetical protein
MIRPLAVPFDPVNAYLIQLISREQPSGRKAAFLFNKAIWFNWREIMDKDSLNPH